MRGLAFYILENDSGTPPAKQLYVFKVVNIWKKSPKSGNIESSETIIEEEQLEDTSWEFLCT
jgi:hypothetical protein